MKITPEAQFVREVRVRPVKAKAMQLRYYESRDETSRGVRRIEACLSVEINGACDQGAVFYHLKQGSSDPIVSDGDWVVVDSFGKPSIVKDKDFNVYYEPE